MIRLIVSCIWGAIMSNDRWSPSRNDTRRKDDSPNDRRVYNTTNEGKLRNAVFDSLVHAIQYNIDGCIRWSSVSAFEDRIRRIMKVIEQEIKYEVSDFEN